MAGGSGKKNRRLSARFWTDASWRRIGTHPELDGFPQRKVKAMDRATLRQTLLEQLQVETGDSYDSLDDDLALRDGLGLDSIDVVTLMISFQERLGIDLRSEELEKVVKVGDLLDLIQVKLAGRAAA
jgi:acyl carrier protein